MNLDDLRLELAQFAQDRDWDQFHSIRNLLLALVGEVGEAAEIIQWTSDKDIPALLNDGGREKLAEELADILLYLVRLADKSGVDLEKAVTAKLALNAQKYPVNQARGSAKKYTELGN
jgi:dCTP diphosphatase